MSGDSPTAICGACHRMLTPRAQYCAACGTKVAGATPAAAPARLSERKFVTVVFIDVVGSLSLIRDKDPEDAHEVLTAAVAVMSAAVHAYGGVIVDRLGDGVMAIFGAPNAQEDHATRACHAAWRLHAMAAQTLSASIAMRVGMHSGEVAVGSAQGDFAVDYTATGAVVHIASRLQSLAPSNATLMTARTAQLVRDAMLTRPFGRFDLNGLDAPLELHLLQGPLTDQDRRGEDAARPFVGRARAIAALDAALAAALAGQGHVVGLSGEAGIGKTALIDRFVQRQASAGALLRSRAEHHTSVAPLQPFAGLVLQALGLAGQPLAQRRQALGERLAALGLDRAEYEPPLLELLELRDPAQAWTLLTPQLRRDRIGAAVIRVLLAASRRQALLVVIEDLQRADSASVDLVGQLAASIAGHRMLVIAAFRPDFAQGWEGQANYTPLSLERLSDDETRTLIASHLGRPVLPQIERRLVDWSKGNPLFLGESLRAMAEAGVASSADDDPEAAARMAVPPSISAVIAARIDRLAPSTKAVLLAAGVLGGHFVAEVLARVLGVEADALQAELDLLVAAGFVRAPSPGQAQAGYLFEHDLLHEVSCATLLRRQRRDLHRAAYAALREPVGAEAAPPVEELARHAFGGELWADAVEYCGEAGRRAAARYSNREAVLQLENATAALNHADPTGLRLREAIALRLQLRSASIPLLRLERIGTLLAEAHGMAQRLGDLALRIKTTTFLGGHAYLTHSPARCIELCGAALRLAQRADDAKLRIAPQLYLAQAQYGLGNYRRVVATLAHDPTMEDPACSGADVGLPLRPVLMRGYWLAISQAELGRFDAAEDVATEMLALADPQQPFETLYSLTARGFIRLLRGELAPALEASSAALALADRHEITFIVPVLASQVGYLLAAQGRAAEGLAMARRAMRKADEIGGSAGRARWCARLAEACLAAGEIDEARRHTRTALTAAEEGGEAGYLCSALRLRAKTLVAAGDLAGAGPDLQRAEQLARQLQLAPALAKCNFDAGLLAWHGGQREEAARRLRRAARAFATCDMPAAGARVAAALQALRSGGAVPPLQAWFGSAE